MSPTRHLGRRLTRLAAAAALALLAACGGSTTQYEAFTPERVVVFGDDNSVLTATGRRYGVNGLDANGNFDCNLEPLWMQSVAARYGYVFAECNTATVPAVPKAVTLATVGARVSDAAGAQLAALQASGGVRDKDLVLVMIGINDVLELYAQYPTRSEDSLLEEARQRGEAAARLVNRLVELGGRVVVSNLPDVGLSPFARAEAATHAASGFDRAALITRLTTAFNEQLGVKVLLDGRFVGLVQFDLRTQLIARAPGSDGIIYFNVPFCAATATAPACTTGTPSGAGAVSSQYLWAQGALLGTGGQNVLASGALTRAVNNPF
jgi:outer membrane lipase/esterase